MKKISRRTVLKGMLGGAVITVGLPWLEFFNTPAAAAGSAFPQRFGMFFWGNGVHPDRWVPAKTGPDWVPDDQLGALADIKEHVTVVTGLEVKTPNIIPHTSGAAGILTGMALQGSGDSTTFAGPTIDQIVAGELGGATRFRSLEFGAHPGPGLSYNGPNSLNPPESDPHAMWERIFGAGFRAPGDTTKADPSIGLRRSVLDAVASDTADLKKKLGATDKARLDQHLEGVRELETRLARLQEDPPNLASCMAPPAPDADFSPIDGRPQISEKNRAMSDIIAMALACDQTRIFSNFITEPVNDILFPNCTMGHHQLTHDEPGDQPQVHSIILRLVAEYTYFVQALAAIPEGDETVLDHCVVLATTDVSYGRTHSLDEFPLMYAGSAGGRLLNGQHVRYENKENASRLQLTFMQALGMTAESFGSEDGYTEDVLSELLV